MGENVEARAYRPSDLLMLFQTVGLVAGNATVEMESRKAALAIAGAPLRDQLTGAAQEASRILSGGADLATQARIGAWIAQAIDCAFYVIKGAGGGAEKDREGEARETRLAPDSPIFAPEILTPTLIAAQESCIWRQN